VADWDSLAGGFDEAFFEDPMYARILETMAMEVSDAGGQRVLDLGCGTGNLIALLLEKFPDIKIAGVDPSAGMRAVSAERFMAHPNIEITAGDALDIPLPGGSIDLIVSSLALHHVSPHLKPLCAKEMARVLVPGGRLIHADPFCGVPGPSDNPERWRDIIEKLVAKAVYSLEHGAWKMMLGELQAIPMVLREEGEYMVTVEEWEAVLREAGFAEFVIIDLPPLELLKIVCCTLGGHISGSVS